MCCSYIFSLFFSKRYNNNNNNNSRSVIWPSLDSIPYFSFKDKTFSIKPCNIYDGDTFTACFFYKDEFIKYKCRCYGYDSPEMKPLLSNPNRDQEKELALIAKNRFIELLSSSDNITIKCGDFDKYGRLLVTVYSDKFNKSINDIMVEEGHGKPYFGGTKD
jgi:endonuclease YncB( thermonuclease family)